MKVEVVQFLNGKYGVRVRRPFLRDKYVSIFLPETRSYTSKKDIYEFATTSNYLDAQIAKEYYLKSFRHKNFTTKHAKVVEDDS